jgi:hypothetical protein
MHSTAYAHQLKNGEWEVRLSIPGHLVSDKHPTLHKTKEAADLWIASPDGYTGRFDGGAGRTRTSNQIVMSGRL